MSTLKSDNGSIPVHQQIVAAASGALVVSVLLTPIDVIKIRLQSQIRPLAKGECFLFSSGLVDRFCTNCSEPSSSTKCEWYNRPGHFTGTLDAFSKIARNEGVRSLWSGLWPTIISAIPATVLYFAIYDNLSQHFRKRVNNQWMPPLMAGTVARASIVFFVSPLEMLRTKMQSEIVSFGDLKKYIRVSVKHDGVSSLWRGLNATFLRDIPFSGIYWTSYELSKSRISGEKFNFPISFMCGVMSGTIASVITQPFDVVKTQRQITLGQARSPAVGQQGSSNVLSTDKSVMTVMQQIAKEGGLRGLFAGLTPRLVKIPPACGIMIGTYEYMKQWFSRRNLKK